MTGTGGEGHQQTVTRNRPSPSGEGELGQMRATLGVEVTGMRDIFPGSSFQDQVACGREGRGSGMRQNRDV